MSNFEEIYSLPFDQYNRLYARFISKERTARLLWHLDVYDRVVLDLCCGEGNLSKMTIDNGAKMVQSVDGNQHVLNSQVLKGLGDKCVITCQNVPNFDVIENISRVFCQQAINYWFSQDNLRTLCKNLEKSNKNKDEVQFCFNTFIFDKSNLFDAVEEKYSINGIQYEEKNWIVGGMMHHTQIVDGTLAHFTKFKIISRADYQGVLGMYFKEVQEWKYGRTSIWVSKGLR